MPRTTHAFSEYGRFYNVISACQEQFSSFHLGLLRSLALAATAHVTGCLLTLFQHKEEETDFNYFSTNRMPLSISK